MADGTKVGTIWTDGDLDQIVADYFAMLADDLAGRSYVKSQHNEILTSRTGRTRGSVEYKYQNISAVLDKLGMHRIPGYKPAAHYQGAIAEAIGRYLVRDPAAVMPTVENIKVDALAEIFVPPPQLAPEPPIPDALRRLIGKFDPVERDRRNHALGRAGEKFVVEVERRQLTDAGRPDLSRRVRWVAEEDGDGAGYDVLSFAPSGGERLLEVNTTHGSARTPFFLTRNELDSAMDRPEDWCIYRVHLFARSPRIFTVAPPLEGSIRLRPELWRASL
jgi:hypothetical protein